MKSAVSIRPATELDTQFLLDCCIAMDKEDGIEGEFHATPAGFQKWIFETKLARAFIAEVEGKRAGMTIFSTSFFASDGKPSIYITKIYTLPQFRKAGVGRALMSAVATYCKDGNYMRVCWSALDKDAQALAFYQKLQAQRLDGVSIYFLPS